MKEIILNRKKIGNNNPIFLIAEIGVNHNGKISIAKKLIDKAVEAKVDAVKFQTFISENVLIKSTPKVEYAKKSEEDEESFYDMVKQFELSKEKFRVIT